MHNANCMILSSMLSYFSACKIEKLGMGLGIDGSQHIMFTRATVFLIMISPSTTFESSISGVELCTQTMQEQYGMYN